MDKQNGRLWITDIAGVTGDVFEKIVGKLKRERKFGPPPPLGYPKVGPERITMRMGWPSIQFKGPGIYIQERSGHFRITFAVKGKS